MAAAIRAAAAAPRTNLGAVRTPRPYPRTTSSPHPSPPLGVEERVPEAGEEAPWFKVPMREGISWRLPEITKLPQSSLLHSHCDLPGIGWNREAA